MARRQIINELHRSARKNFKRRRVVMRGIDDLWQADLVEMCEFSKINKGFRYLLTVIDTFSKFAWAIPIKRKTGVEVTNAFNLILLHDRRTPQNLQTYDGKEFFNSTFQKLMIKHKINHYSTYSSLKASIVERWNRTLKNKMWREFSMNGSNRWIDILKQLVDTYNETEHRTIKMRPCDVTHNLENLYCTTFTHQNIEQSKI